MLERVLVKRLRDSDSDSDSEEGSSSGSQSKKSCADKPTDILTSDKAADVQVCGTPVAEKCLEEFTLFDF